MTPAPQPLPTTPFRYPFPVDFFEAQDRARRRTKRLVLLFMLAVLGTIIAGYAATMVGVNYQNPQQRYHRDASPPAREIVYWDPRVFGTVSLVTIAIVGFASLFKWSQMRAGGSAVAEMIGGRHVSPQTVDLAERRLLNVVEEMAIASGVPVPAVYILDNEPALNAFAAGLTTSDAAVAVTRGTLEKLNRDELQGVIAHEFSHILNGDMRLNVKLTAIVFGILVIGLVGRGVLYSMRRTRVRSSNRKGGGGIAFVLAIGLAMLVIGYVGYFFGRLIQAAVSRQREYLADASAVQFTRNPSGIGGALKKIGGYALGSTILDRHAGEMGHFFFAQSFRSMFGGLWATHPDLGERIRAIEPQWDGRLFEPPAVVDLATESSATAGFSRGTRHTPDEAVSRMHSARPDLPPPIPRARIAFTPATVIADIGALTAAHFRQAQSLLDAVPARVREAAHDVAQAPALVFGLLSGSTGEQRAKADGIIGQHAGTDVSARLAHLRPAISVLDPGARLPLLQLCVPALRALGPAGLDPFITTLDELVHADGQVDVFEFALQKMLVHQLKLGAAPSQRIQYHSFQPLVTDIAVILSTLASLGARKVEAVPVEPQPVAVAAKTSPVVPAGDSSASHPGRGPRGAGENPRAGAADAGARAFAKGAAELPLIVRQLIYLGAADLGKVDAALDRLATAAPPIKQRVLHAAATVMSADGTVTVGEGELYRAFAAALDVPVPLL